MKSKPVLSKLDRQQLAEAMAATDFDQALHLTPAIVLDRLYQATGGMEGAHDLFDSDMFPPGWKPLSRNKRAKLDVKIEALEKRRSRRRPT